MYTSVYICMSLYALAAVLSCAAIGLTPDPHVPSGCSYTFGLDSAPIKNEKVGSRIVEQ